MHVMPAMPTVRPIVTIGVGVGTGFRALVVESSIGVCFESPVESSAGVSFQSSVGEFLAGLAGWY